MSESPIIPELLTVRDYVRFAVSRFREAQLSYGHGTPDAVDDAAFLVLETLHLPIDQLEPWLEARLTRAERQQVAAAIEQRVVTRKPSAYITGSAYLGPYKFRVDERVIVPRSFIGELMLAADADGALPFGLDAPPRRVLDLCTGSGCLAIVAAQLFDGADVTAVELSKGALAVAHDNVRQHRLDGRVTLVEGNLLDSLGNVAFDLIIANPPYVTAEAVKQFPAEHQAEPVMAHLGGPDGMDLVRRILADAGRFLTPDGLLVVEVGQGQATLEVEYPDLPFLWFDTEHSAGEVFALPAQALQEKKGGVRKAKPQPKQSRRTKSSAT